MIRVSSIWPLFPSVKCIQTSEEREYFTFAGDQPIRRSLCDTAVPTKKGLELRRNMGKPETILVPTGHYSALLDIPYIQGQCARFFREKLDLKQTPAEASKAVMLAP